MSKKYEAVEVNGLAVLVDISELARKGEMYFNATVIAKHFNKKPDDFLRLQDTKEYLLIIEEDFLSREFPTPELSRIQHGGKYKGTWMHNSLALKFARWCSQRFEFHLDRWIEERFEEEKSRKLKRDEARSGYLPMTNAIQAAHDDPKFYHYSNEADMINRLVTGMTAKQFCEKHSVNEVRDACDFTTIARIERAQKINTSLIEVGISFTERMSMLADVIGVHSAPKLEAVKLNDK